MGLRDGTGMNIHEGSLVDICAVGMLQGMVVKVVDTGRVLGNPVQPHILVQCIVPIPINDRNRCPQVYVTGRLDKNGKPVMTNENADGIEGNGANNGSGPKLVDVSGREINKG